MNCAWEKQENYDYRYWETECGKSFMFTDNENLSENEFKFCPYCGGAIKESEIASHRKNTGARNDINKEL